MDEEQSDMATGNEGDKSQEEQQLQEKHQRDAAKTGKK